MAKKDFAKSSKKRTGASRFNKKKSRQPIPGWMWLVAGLAIGIFVTFVINMEFGLPKTIIPSQKVKEPISAKSRYQAVPAEEASDSDFNFHEMLENKTVEVPAEDSKPLIKNTTKKRYIMQCGSFRKKAQAESLRAQIALNGFEANINSTISKSGSRWYRVTLGPYESKRTAERERHQLERNNINHCRIW